MLACSPYRSTNCLRTSFRRTSGPKPSYTRAVQKTMRIPGPSSLGDTSKVMNTGAVSVNASPESPSARQKGLS
ncbi:Uncharacterised protein [Mycobacteroides abscessus subsp. abscessus]|nr:Uncharacterised protein [Mycobacteroides abscessus subsp. abscessus]